MTPILRNQPVHATERSAFRVPKGAGKQLTIGIRGAAAANKGAEAMLKTTTQQLRQRLDCDFDISPLRPFAKSVDAIVDISGFAYSSQPRWARHSIRSALEVRAAQPSVSWFFLPQSFGPFEEDIAEDCRRVLRGATVVARDRNSWNHLKELYGDFQLQQATDVTWAFSGDTVHGESLLRGIGIDPAQPLVAIGPNMRVRETRPGYLECLKGLIAEFQSVAQVVLVPHEINDPETDDRALCRKLPAPALLGSYTAEQLKGAIAHCDMLIGSRYHGLMGALSQAIPCVAIGWAEKYQTLMRGLSLGDYCVERLEESIDMSRNCWNSRQDIQMQLRSLAQRHRQEVKSLFDVVCRQIEGQPEKQVAGFSTPVRQGIEQNRGARGDYFNFRRNVHRLEKGIIANARSDLKRTFAGDYIAETVTWLEAHVNDSSWDGETIQWGLETLQHYFQLHRRSPLVERFEKIRAQTTTAVVARPYPAEDRPSPAVTTAEFSQLCERRRSIRFYEDRIPPREIVQCCLEIALQSPSACNRQAFRFQYYDDRAMVDRIAKIPYGARDLKLPALLVIIGCYEGYFDARDVKCPIIDASLAAMSLMLALETVGLSSVPINFPELPSFRHQASQVCDLDSSEIIVMLMGIGFADPNGLVAVSRKRTTQQLLTVNPHQKKPVNG